MADTSHLTEYAPLLRHREEMRGAVLKQRKRLMIVAVVVVLVTVTGYWLTPPLGIMLAGIGAMVLFFTAMTGGSSVPPDLLTGIEGEVRALETLEKLPDSQVLFNQVYVPDPSLPNGRRELDFVVVGPAGVTVVEVKNTPGLIYVKPEEKQWPVGRRAGCGGRPGWNAVDNPVSQVTAQVRALENWLLKQGITARANAVICFARPDVVIENADASPVPVTTVENLLAQVKTGGQPANHDPAPTIRALRSLKGGRQPHSAAAA